MFSRSSHWKIPENILSSIVILKLFLWNKFLKIYHRHVLGEMRRERVTTMIPSVIAVWECEEDTGCVVEKNGNRTEYVCGWNFLEHVFQFSVKFMYLVYLLTFCRTGYHTFRKQTHENDIVLVAGGKKEWTTMYTETYSMHLSKYFIWNK